DIMDEAPIRRGRPTIHEKRNKEIAILSGDVLYTQAFSFLTKNEAHYLPDLFVVFNKMAKEACEGQQLDMEFEEKPQISIADYMEMIRLKTSVLLGAAL